MHACPCAGRSPVCFVRVASSRRPLRPQIIGNLLYYRYMNPAIVAPDAFDIIDLSAGGQLTTDQRRNLGSIAKMLQHAASNKMFLGDNAHLSVINEYLSQSYQKFRCGHRARAPESLCGPVSLSAGKGERLNAPGCAPVGRAGDVLRAPGRGEGDF